MYRWREIASAKFEAYEYLVTVYRLWAAWPDEEFPVDHWLLRVNRLDTITDELGWSVVRVSCAYGAQLRMQFIDRGQLGEVWQTLRDFRPPYAKLGAMGFEVIGG